MKINYSLDNETLTRLGQLSRHEATSVSLLGMIADRERFLHDVELGRRNVLIVRQREQEGLVRGDVLRLGVGLAPWNVAESTAYLATHPLRHSSVNLKQITLTEGTRSEGTR